MQRRYEDRSLGDLFSDLAREMSELMRHEVRLARTELSQKASEAGSHVAWIGIGAAIAYAGLLVLMAALVLGLVELGLSPWLAALLVGGVAAGAGAVFAYQSLNALRHEDFVPRETIRSLSEDRDWLKEQAS